MDAWETVAVEAERGFDWLCENVAVDEPVTFVPNPGNIGDALINLSCYRYVAARFASVSLCSVGETPRTSCVFIAGGGNLIEGVYSSVSDFVLERCAGRRLFFFPATVKGFDSWLARLSGSARMVCRETVTFAHVSQCWPQEDVLLAHDAAFWIAGRLRSVFADAIRHHPPGTARFFRDDGERAHRLPSDRDIMGESGGDWLDLARAERAVAETAMTLLSFSRIYTDRLHCAILAAILDRYVVLVPNSYYKNAAVFDHSLSRFANVRFEDGQVVLPPRG